MPLPELHPLSELVVAAQTSSIGTTPVAVYTRVPFRGKILKIGCVYQGAITGTGSLQAATNNTGSFVDVTGGLATLAAGGAGTHASAVPTALNDVNEDDVIRFTPGAGATGTSIGGLCYAVIRRS